jgi:hypothetical protein
VTVERQLRAARLGWNLMGPGDVADLESEHARLETRLRELVTDKEGQRQ